MDCTGIDRIILTTDVYFDSIFFPHRKYTIPAGTVCQIVDDLTTGDEIKLLVKHFDFQFVVDATQFVIDERGEK